MSDNSVPIGSYRGVKLRKLSAPKGDKALYIVGDYVEVVTSLGFAVFLIDRMKGGKK